MQEKLALLQEKLCAYDRLAVAFSGGVDSTFLLLAAAVLAPVSGCAHGRGPR